MTTATKTAKRHAPKRVEDALLVALSAVEKAGREIVHLAKTGQKKIKAHDGAVKEKAK